LSVRKFNLIFLLVINSPTPENKKRKIKK
jgi:hypothetical protein